MDLKQVAELIGGEKYYSIDDLRYNQKVGIMFSKDEFEQFLSIKDQLIDDGFEYIKTVPLKTFNSKHCFYVDALYLLQTQNEYLRLYVSDYEINQISLFDRNIEDMLTSRLFSEVEGTLNIENIPTTHRHIVEVSTKEKLTDQNDIIVKSAVRNVDFLTPFVKIKTIYISNSFGFHPCWLLNH